jgi:hypothetical protein
MVIGHLSVNGLHLVIDGVGENGQDSFEYVSVSLLNRSYKFHSIYNVNYPMLAHDIHPTRPYLFVRMEGLEDIIYHFAYFQVNSLRSIADRHGVVIGPWDSKTQAQILLCNHVCSASCLSALLVFKCLSTP